MGDHQIVFLASGKKFCLICFSYKLLPTDLLPTCQYQCRPVRCYEEDDAKPCPRKRDAIHNHGVTQQKETLTIGTFVTLQPSRNQIRQQPKSTRSKLTDLINDEPLFVHKSFVIYRISRTRMIYKLSLPFRSLWKSCKYATSFSLLVTRIRRTPSSLLGFATKTLKTWNASYCI